MKKLPIKRVAAIVLFFVLSALIIGLSRIYTDYIELSEIGGNFTAVFWRNFNVHAITMAMAFVIFFTLFLTNLLAIRRNLVGMDRSFAFLRRTLPLVAVSILLGIVFADYARRLIADTFLPFLSSEWFDRGDPIFHKDVGYYVFQRPFHIAVSKTLLGFGVFAMFFTALAYIVLYARYDFYNMKQLLREKGIIVHQIITVILYFLIKAFSYRYESEEILFKVNKEFVGAGYIDAHIWREFYKILSVLLIAIVALTIVFALNSKYQFAITTVLGYPVAVLVVVLLGQAMQTLVVSPNEFKVEAQYLQENINFTRAAYGLDKVTNYDVEVKYDLTGQDIMNNLGTMNNIRLIDYDQTIKAANQIQSIRSYYHFFDTDIVPYTIDGKPTAVAVSAREVTTDNLDETAKNYINTKMKYTHGTGLVMNPINRVTEQGQPYFVIRDIPPRSLEGTPEISQPRIYFGETMQDHVIVGTRDKELDDIDTEGFSYDGAAGIRLTLMNRFAYALKYGDFKLLVSDQISSDSKILTNRVVMERVRKAAPFLTLDSDAYLLIDGGGRLKWVVDGYTSTKWYPYSQYNGDINYIRNPVKAVVDAYDGSVKFYITDRSDPIIRSYERIYPTLFEQTGFPSDLAEHIRYPEDIFKIQAEMLKRYHINNAGDFYEKSGVWAAARQKYMGDKPQNIEPYYTLMKVQGGTREEFVLMLPYTPLGKDNMVSWLAARCGAENYGQLVCYRFGQNENVYGPYDIEKKIDNDPALAQELALWGDSVVRGNLLVIPVKNSILYVEPIYISSGKDKGQLPEVKRIVLAYGDRIVAKPTLDEAIRSMFGVNRPTVVTTNEESMDDVIQRVIKSFDDVKAYSKQNDWENYGKAIKELEENISVLREKNTETHQESGQTDENPLTNQR